MLIQCTKTLRDKIGIKESELVAYDQNEAFPESFTAWQANIITMNRKKAIVLMNNETRYPVVIYRPVKKDFANIKNLILEAIAEAFRMEGVSQSVIDAYISENKKVSFSKTANNSMIGKLNNTVKDIEFREAFLNDETKIQRDINLQAGRMMQTYEKNYDYDFPNEKLLQTLELIYGPYKEVMDVELYKFKIQLDLPGHSVWRRVLVPSTYSFNYLHNVIQTVFDWQNYHLHSFFVGRGDDKPLNIVMDDNPAQLEFLNFDVFDVRQERFIMLDEVFPKFTEVMYEYDFGDSWEHTITLEKIVKANELKAKFLEGNGERPPEDVGGQRGYEEYLEIMANEQDSLHDEMKLWAEEQTERKFPKEKINQRLEEVITGYSTFVME